MRTIYVDLLDDRGERLATATVPIQPAGKVGDAGGVPHVKWVGVPTDKHHGVAEKEGRAVKFVARDARGRVVHAGSVGEGQQMTFNNPHFVVGGFIHIQPFSLDVPLIPPWAMGLGDDVPAEVVTWYKRAVGLFGL